MSRESLTGVRHLFHTASTHQSSFMGLLAGMLKTPSRLSLASPSLFLRQIIVLLLPVSASFYERRSPKSIHPPIHTSVNLSIHNIGRLPPLIASVLHFFYPQMMHTMCCCTYVLGSKVYFARGFCHLFVQPLPFASPLTKVRSENISTRQSGHVCRLTFPAISRAQSVHMTL